MESVQEIPQSIGGDRSNGRNVVGMARRGCRAESSEAPAPDGAEGSLPGPVQDSAGVPAGHQSLSLRRSSLALGQKPLVTRSIKCRRDGGPGLGADLPQLEALLRGGLLLLEDLG